MLRSPTITRTRLRLLKTVLFIACLLPAGGMILGIYGVEGFGLGANPVEELIHRNGEWALRLLLATLAVTPIRRLTGAAWLVRLRRMLGLFAFFYAILHFLAYAIIDQGLALDFIIEDVIERPFITLGVLALLMLLPLAATSTDGMMRRLGRRWKKLHRLVYPIAILGVWHYWWQVKQDVREPVVYAAILAILLGYRLWTRPRVHRRPIQDRQTQDPATG
jgi:sulfoxide reductase heme-binding subunit YedZ